jgi:hypothetical protein
MHAGQIRSRRPCGRTSGHATASASSLALGSPTSASVGSSSITSGRRAAWGCGVAAPPTTSCCSAQWLIASRRSRGAAGAPSCSPGSSTRSGKLTDRMGRRRRTGGGGCLGELVVVALLVWPIHLLQPVFGWSDAETSPLELAWCRLLAVGAAVRGRASVRTASETTRGRLGSACEMGQAEAARRREAQAPCAFREPHLNRMRRPTGPRVVQNPLRGPLPANVSSERSDRARADHRPTGRARRQATASGEPRIPLPRRCASASCNATASAAATAVARATLPASSCTWTTSCRPLLAPPRRRTICSRRVMSAISARPPGQLCRPDPDARATESVHSRGWGFRTSASVRSSSTTCALRAVWGCGVAAPPTTSCCSAHRPISRRRCMGGSGARSCLPGSSGPSGNACPVVSAPERPPGPSP